MAARFPRLRVTSEFAGEIRSNVALTRNEITRTTSKTKGRPFIPRATGILHPFFGLLLSRMIARAAISLSSVSVITNTLRAPANAALDAAIFPDMTAPNHRDRRVIALELNRNARDSSLSHGGEI